MKAIGVIGLGSIGMRHAKNLVGLGYQVFGFDPDEARTEELMNYYADEQLPPGTSPDVKEIIHMSTALVVANPTKMHHRTYMDIVINGGNKPVFMEKPVSHVFDPMLSHVVMVGYNLRFHSCVQAAKQWLVEGRIGKPVWANFVCSQYNNKPDYLRDGVILNWSHEIDLATYLLGKADVLGSFTRVETGNEDLADITLSHKAGCRTTIHLDYLTKPEIRQGIIVGTEGMLIMDLVNRQAWLRGKAGIVMDHFAGIDTYDENYVEEMQAFIDRINGQQVFGCTGNEALDVLSICLEAKKLSKLSIDEQYMKAFPMMKVNQ